MIRVRAKSASELLDVLRPLGLEVIWISIGRLRLRDADGRPVEAWQSGPNWVIGDPDDLAELFSPGAARRLADFLDWVRNAPPFPGSVESS